MSSQTVTREPRLAQATLMDQQQPTGQTSLVKVGSAEIDVKPITDPRTLVARVQQLREQFNIIAPPVQVMGDFTPGYALTAAIVTINTTVNDDGQGGEVYRDRAFMASNQRALGKVGLLKVLSAAGGKWTANTGRRDDGRIQYYWTYYAECEVSTPDGDFQILSGEVEIDMRDGSPQIGGWTPEAWAEVVKANQGKKKEDQQKSINGWSDRRVLQARGMGARLAETKAKNRAIRSLGLQQVYTEQELRKPFLIFKAQYQYDMSDPEVRRMVAQRALHGRQLLFPGAARHEARVMVTTPIPPAGTLDAELLDEEATNAAASQPQETKPAAPATPAEPPLFVIDVKAVGVNEATNQEMNDVFLSDGRIARTDDHDRSMAAAQLWKAEKPVVVRLRPSAKRPGAWILDDILPVEQDDMPRKGTSETLL